MKTTRRTFFGQLLGWATAPFIAKAVPMKRPPPYKWTLLSAPDFANRKTKVLEFDESELAGTINAVDQSAKGLTEGYCRWISEDEPALAQTIAALEQFERSIDKITRGLA